MGYSYQIYEVAKRFIGLKEIPGEKDNPFIQWCFSLCGYPMNTPDEVPWCGVWVEGMLFICGRERSKSASARSHLLIGEPVKLEDAELGDIVILKRGKEPQPDASVINALGHVGFFGGLVGDSRISLLGGNQGNQVSILPFPITSILGIRRV